MLALALRTILVAIHRLHERPSRGVMFVQAQIERVRRSPFGPQRQQAVATRTGFAYARALGTRPGSG